MRILDQQNVEIASPNLSLGYLIADEIFVKHHEAIKAVEEEGHYEVIAEYPNGGKDVEWIVDVEAVEAVDEWDEYEEVRRYIPYTEEELVRIQEELNKPTDQQRIEMLEAENENLKSEIATLMECILEMSEVVYA